MGQGLDSSGVWLKSGVAKEVLEVVYLASLGNEEGAAVLVEAKA